MGGEDRGGPGASLPPAATLPPVRYFVVCVCICFAASAARGQARYVALGPAFGLGFPQADWGDRYGRLGLAGVQAEYAARERWSFAARLEIGFGDDVRVDPLAEVRSPSGPLLGEDGLGEVGFSEVTPRARAYRLQVIVGHERPLGGSPWRWYAGAGPHYLLHAIRFQEDPALLTPQLDNGRAGGYDRRAGGLGATAEVGLRYVDRGGRYVGFATGSAGFTATAALRDTQFDLGEADYQAGADATVGVRVGILLALYRDTNGGAAPEDIYY